MLWARLRYLHHFKYQSFKTKFILGVLVCNYIRGMNVFVSVRRECFKYSGLEFENKVLKLVYTCLKILAIPLFPLWPLNVAVSQGSQTWATFSFLYFPSYHLPRWFYPVPWLSVAFITGDLLVCYQYLVLT